MEAKAPKSAKFSTVTDEITATTSSVRGHHARELMRLAIAMSTIQSNDTGEAENLLRRALEIQNPAMGTPVVKWLVPWKGLGCAL